MQHTMEQASNNNNKMESTNVLEKYRDEEKQLSESLYRNLHTMQRFHEPTTEFLQIFEPHMFIKSNAKAFPPVMHFIFNCMDPSEFNKRFRWPILDKTGESNFRKTTVDYMNHLNVTHQLGLETLKMSNIHIPGGLKFIKIIHKFSYLAMKIELTKAVHQPLPNMQNLPDSNEMLEKLKLYVEQGMVFVTRLQVQSDKLNERINEMNNMMDSCFDGTTAMSKEVRCWACLGKEWRNELDRVVRDEVGPKLEIVNVFSRRTVELNQLFTKLFVDRKDNLVEYDKDQLAVAQNALKMMDPRSERVIDGMVDGGMINFDNLFKVFSSMLPGIMQKLETFKFRDLEAIEFESNEIFQLETILSKYEAEYHEYYQVIEPFLIKYEEKFKTFCQNYNTLPFCLLQTPPVTRKCRTDRMRNRLSLINDSTSKVKLFKQPATNRTSKNATMVRTSSCTSLNESRSAALQLLTRPRSRLNSSSQSSFHNMSTLSKFSTPKLSSTMASASVAKRKQPELKFSPAFPMTPTHVFSENFSETTSMVSPNGVSVVRKVATSSVYHLNPPHMRSPTRHFYVTDIPPGFIAYTQAQAANGNGNPAEIESGTRMDDFQNNNRIEATNAKGFRNGNDEDVNREAEFVTAALDAVCSDTDELIGDVSDTVLHDISSE